MVLKAAPGAFPPASSRSRRSRPAPILVVGMPPSAPCLKPTSTWVRSGTSKWCRLEGRPRARPHRDEPGGGLRPYGRRCVSGRRVCVLAQGDPGFFGIGRAFAERFGPGSLEVRPAPSLVSLAFARLGLPWDDAVVVSAQGRNPGDAFMVAHRASSSGHKVAVISGPDAPPERVG